MIGVLFILFALHPVPENYKLQIGDEIAVTISGQINFTYTQIISPQGTIFIQSGGKPVQTPEKIETPIVPAGGTVLGTLKVFNITVNEATTKIQEEFNKYFKNINATLTIVAFHDVVYVNGAVTIPGAYPFFPGKPAMEYIGLAGGLNERADIKKSYIVKNNRKIPLTSDTKIERDDIIVVNLLTFKWWQDYVSIASTFTSIVYTSVLVWLSFQQIKK
ncbi:MAG: SLBB domain-containing protein [bacterium]|nr:SLBB domain-containing protein [bacterium]